MGSSKKLINYKKLAFPARDTYFVPGIRLLQELIAENYVIVATTEKVTSVDKMSQT